MKNFIFLLFCLVTASVSGQSAIPQGIQIVLDAGTALEGLHNVQTSWGSDYQYQTDVDFTNGVGVLILVPQPAQAFPPTGLIEITIDPADGSGGIVLSSPVWSAPFSYQSQQAEQLSADSSAIDDIVIVNNLRLRVQPTLVFDPTSGQDPLPGCTGSTRLPTKFELKTILKDPYIATIDFQASAEFYFSGSFLDNPSIIMKLNGGIEQSIPNLFQSWNMCVEEVQ